MKVVDLVLSQQRGNANNLRENVLSIDNSPGGPRGVRGRFAAEQSSRAATLQTPEVESEERGSQPRNLNTALVREQMDQTWGTSRTPASYLGRKIKLHAANHVVGALRTRAYAHTRQTHAQNLETKLPVSIRGYDKILALWDIPDARTVSRSEESFGRESSAIRAEESRGVPAEGGSTALIV
ncbi:hypothetical protein F4810DRAFT_712131 [Camillea tinctor]|nr:hypothetical protein F4810DRAFT_712131 [Camillea tinctor]